MGTAFLPSQHLHEVGSVVEAQQCLPDQMEKRQEPPYSAAWARSPRGSLEYRHVGEGTKAPRWAWLWDSE